MDRVRHVRRHARRARARLVERLAICREPLEQAWEHGTARATDAVTTDFFVVEQRDDADRRRILHAQERG